MSSNRSTIPVLLAVLIAGFFLVPAATTAEAPETKADHIAAAERYEKMAAEQDAVAAEHRAMFKQYQANAHHYPKQSREKLMASMRKHCNAISRDAEKLAADYRAVAKWHRTAAAELEE